MCKKVIVLTDIVTEEINVIVHTYETGRPQCDIDEKYPSYEDIWENL